MSIRVRLVLCADFREIVGKREIVKEINPNSTLKHILDKLANKYGRDFKQIIDPKTVTISLEFLISINGRITRDTNVKLNNDDIVMITIPAGGG
ncbi:MoaD/ThiS family protein [Candidatus Bathyarchaeota archaeon]|nr:MoaD/ThiS family protein [Candidatus Bathyarchaeota archaeon]